MKVEWKYIIEINDKDVFIKFKNKYGIEVPEDLKELIIKANGGIPTKTILKDENGEERIFAAILSFNKEDDDNVYVAMDANNYTDKIPFAIDPFGNFFYYNMANGEIEFVTHENENVIKIAGSLSEMIGKMY